MTWLASVDSSDLYLSVLVLGEIRQGVERLARRDPAQAEAYEAWLHRLGRDYGERIIPISAEVADRWGRMNVPYPLPTIDGLMAATAAVHGLTFVTRNAGDVKGSGIRVLNPFLRAPHR